MQQKTNQATPSGQTASPPIPIAPGYVCIFGKWQKLAAGALLIPFDFSFDEPPTVTISSVWQGSTVPVGSIDTVTDIKSDHFTVTSGNADKKFFINFIAIGKGEA